MLFAGCRFANSDLALTSSRVGYVAESVPIVVIYEAFVEGNLEAPKHLARTVHDLYFLCGAEIYVASA